jgi:hypothetical protein
MTKNAWPPFDGSGWRALDGSGRRTVNRPGQRAFNKRGPGQDNPYVPARDDDLAAELPDKLHELQRLWLTEAIRHDVLPLDDRRVERFNPDLAGRPQLGTSELLLGGMGRLTEASMINLKNKPHTASGADGVIIAQGGASAAGLYTPKTASRPTATTCSACSAPRGKPTSQSRQAPTR